jgi:hypothetical protein
MESQAVTQSKKLTYPISELYKLVEVSDRYKHLFPQLLEIYQDLYDQKDKSILFEIQPIVAFIKPENAGAFKRLMDDIRVHLNVNVKNSQDCRKRLTALKTIFQGAEERQAINDALDLLNLPNSSEVQSDADFRLLSLQQMSKEMDISVEIQELFIFLNSMFQPVPEGATSSSGKQHKRKQ